MKKLFKVLSVVALGLVLGACSTQKKGETSKSAADKKEVVVGLDDTFVPMGFKDDSGKIVGFDVDLAKSVFELTDQKVKFQPIDWSMKETELKNETIDMIWNGYSVTPQRQKKVTFTDTYMKNTQVLVTPKKSNITKPEQMKGKVLGAQEGSSGYDTFTKQPEVLQDIVKNNDATLYASFNEAFIDLENSRIDGLLIDKVYAEYYLTQAKKLAEYNIIELPFDSEDFSVGVRKDDEKLTKQINEGFKKLQENGKFKEISEKWFGQDVTPKQ